MVRLTSDTAEDGEPLPSEGEDPTHLQGESIKDPHFLLSSVHVPVLVLTGGEA